MRGMCTLPEGDLDSLSVAACTTSCRCFWQVVEVTIPELELVRVAQMVAIGCEIAQACKHAYADPRKRRQMNLETRVTLASTSRFLATDFLQVTDFILTCPRPPSI